MEPFESADYKSPLRTVPLVWQNKKPITSPFMEPSFEHEVIEEEEEVERKSTHSIMILDIIF
jgi:hypothetical protein